jgi:hypothetical protein
VEQLEAEYKKIDAESPYGTVADELGESLGQDPQRIKCVRSFAPPHQQVATDRLRSLICGTSFVRGRKWFDNKRQSERRIPRSRSAGRSRSRSRSASAGRGSSRSTSTSPSAIAKRSADGAGQVAAAAPPPAGDAAAGVVADSDDSDGAGPAAALAAALGQQRRKWPTWDSIHDLVTYHIVGELLSLGLQPMVEADTVTTFGGRRRADIVTMPGNAGDLPGLVIEVSNARKVAKRREGVNQATDDYPVHYCLNTRISSILCCSGGLS